MNAKPNPAFLTFGGAENFGGVLHNIVVANVID